MLTKRIIPCLDCDRGRVVKGVKFFDHVDAGDPVEQAQRYQAAGRMNCVLRHYGQPRRPGDHGRPGPAGHGEDIHAPDGGRGIRTLEDATRLIRAKWRRCRSTRRRCRIRSYWLRSPASLAGVTVLGLDANRVKENGQEKWQVFINGGRKNTGIDVMEWSKQAEALGAGEIVLNVMNADGTTEGYDIEMTAAVSDAVKIPVAASGGPDRRSICWMC